MNFLSNISKLFTFSNFETPIADKLRPKIETNDVEALRKDFEILKKDFEKALYEYKKTI